VSLSPASPSSCKILTQKFFSKAGVELEEAGEKWRAGDAAKSMRFFTRAIDMYDRGLQRHPTNPDLAYNKFVLSLYSLELSVFH
jgi:hypothetical protein